MSTPTGQQPTQTPQREGTAAATPSPRSPGASEGSPLESSQGRTTVADVVVTKIAGMAAREVSGVHGFGTGTSRAWGAMRERIPGARASSSQGVSVEVGEKQTAVDLVIVVDHGVAIAELARAVRRNVIGAVEQMTGLQVVEVNIDVTDLHLPEDEEQQSSATTRVE